MADTFKYVQAQPFSLAGAGAIIGDTSIILKSFTGIDGALLTLTDFGTIGYGTLEPGNGELEEQISFTGVTQNTNGTATLTGVKTVLFVDPYTETSGLAKTHAGSTEFVISNTAGFYAKLTSKADDETITGKWTFPDGANRIQLAADTDTAVATELVTFGQLARTALAGAVKATVAIFGLVRMSVAPASAADPVAVGDNDPRVPTQAENDALIGNNTDIAVSSGNKFVTQTGLQHNAEKYAADAQASDTYVITLSPAPTSYTNGMVVYFKANTVNTGPATLNVNGLGPVTIVKGISTTLADGDIAAGQFCTVIYNGTNFVLQSSTASTGVSLLNVYTPVSTTSSVVETTLVSVSIPGNTLGTTGAVRVKLFFSSVSNTSGATAWTLKFKYGATTIVTYAPQVAWTTVGAYVEVVLMSSGATGTQSASMYSQISSTGPVITSGTATEDSTLAKTLVVTSQFSNSSANDAMTMKMATVEKLVA